MSTEAHPEEAPPYTSDPLREWEVREKQSQPCSAHAGSATPLVDAQMQRPEAKKALQVLSSVFLDMAEGNGCTKCSIKDAARSVTVCVRDLKTAKRNGEWSKEEKKAMKSEVKSAVKEIKLEVKRTWKSKA